jgi:hypothetical protein
MNEYELTCFFTNHSKIIRLIHAKNQSIALRDFLDSISYPEGWEQFSIVIKFIKKIKN